MNMVKHTVYYHAMWSLQEKERMTENSGGFVVWISWKAYIPASPGHRRERKDVADLLLREF